MSRDAATCCILQLELAGGGRAAREWISRRGRSQAGLLNEEDTCCQSLGSRSESAGTRFGQLGSELAEKNPISGANDSDDLLPCFTRLLLLSNLSSFQFVPQLIWFLTSKSHNQQPASQSSSKAISHQLTTSNGAKLSSAKRTRASSRRIQLGSTRQPSELVNSKPIDEQS